MSALLTALLLAAPADAGEIVVALNAPVLVVVDGKVIQPSPGSMQVKAKNLEDGDHLVEIRNAFNKPIVETRVSLGDDEQVRLRYARKEIEEIGRGTLDPKRNQQAEPVAQAPAASGSIADTQAAIAAQQAEITAMAGGFGNASVAATPGQGAPAATAGTSTTTTTQANVAGAGTNLSVSVSVTETTSGGGTVSHSGGPTGGPNIGSTAFVGVDPVVFAIFLDGQPLPWVDGVGGYLAPELVNGSQHKFLMTMGGTTALTADVTVTQPGHEICTIRVMPFDYDVNCVYTGGAAWTRADLARGGSGSMGASMGSSVTMVAPAVPQGPFAMAGGDFERLLQSVKDESFSSDQVDIIATAARNNHFTCSQVARLVDPISFGSDKVAAVKAAHNSIIDPQNAHELEAVFTFSSDKEEVRALFR